jgi:hypothetical protein
VQKNLRETFQVPLTYMETRFLVDDLKLTLKDDPEDEPAKPSATAEADAESLDDPDALAPAPGSGVFSMSLDQIARPNALISGKVTFSDGERAEWSLDQMGRLSLNADTPGYRPSEADIMKFQVELQRLARSQGF